jgi:hypothetical protein
MSSMRGAPDMSQRDRVHPGAGSAGPPAAGRSMWTGWIVFAAVILFLGGLLQIMEGLVALFDEGYYAVGSDGLVVHVDYTVWGVVHLLVGTLACLIGIGLLTGNMVARGAAVFLAGFSALANLVFLAASPAWSLLIIALDIVVIYAVVVHGGELESRS